MTHQDTQRHLTVRVPVEHVEALQAVAAREDRTVSQELRRLIRRRIEGEAATTGPRGTP